MSARESFFLCRYTSPRARRTSHVRAWDEREAAQLFQTELVEEDLREPGTIEVVGTRRPSQRLETWFEPAGEAASPS
ncbi:MAG TPA: hypothetical protein VMG32_03930 [Anaeromyxobacteraceae bacterium]|nr:hypothetical protein [Anaeromyxobacteraceae bacterium]